MATLAPFGTTIGPMTQKLPDHARPPARDRMTLIDGDLTGKVIGGFYKVYNTLGYGFLESVYSRALYIELRQRGLRVEREVNATAYYEGHSVGHFRIDQLVETRLVVEIKATRVLAPTDREQLRNCLKASELQVGLLLHFGPRPAFYRLISENDPRSRRNPAFSGSSALSQSRKELDSGPMRGSVAISDNSLGPAAARVGDDLQ